MRANILSAIIIILMPIVVLLGSFRAELYNRGFYHSEFGSLGVYENVPDADANLERIFSYFQGEKQLGIAGFSQQENRHMRDVKDMIGFASSMFCFLGLVLLAGFIWLLVKDQKRAMVSLLSGSASPVGHHGGEALAAPDTGVPAAVFFQFRRALHQVPRAAVHSGNIPL